MNRREALKRAAALAAAALARPTGAGAQGAPSGGTLRFFPGFTSARVKTSGAEINLVHAGSGPPVLLLHGAPQTHISWRLVAPELAKSHTVIVPDLRGMATRASRPTRPIMATTRSARWRWTRSR